jgi:uncharacterized membrane protein HdeD (DUF308 family)
MEIIYMQNDIKGASWALGLWGVFSVVFGGLVLAWPGITLKAFLVVLGAYFVASGLVLLVGSLVNHQGKWVVGALLGAISTIAGLYVFSNPQISALITLSVIAIWSITAGMLQLVAGFEGKNNWWLIIAGAINTLFGFYIFARPAQGALVLMWLIGLSSIAGGIALIITAFEANSASNRLKTKKA